MKLWSTRRIAPRRVYPWPRSSAPVQARNGSHTLATTLGVSLYLRCTLLASRTGPSRRCNYARTRAERCCKTKFGSSVHVCEFCITRHTGSGRAATVSVRAINGINCNSLVPHADRDAAPARTPGGCATRHAPPPAPHASNFEMYRTLISLARATARLNVACLRPSPGPVAQSTGAPRMPQTEAWILSCMTLIPVPFEHFQYACLD